MALPAKARTSDDPLADLVEHWEETTRSIAALLRISKLGRVRPSLPSAEAGPTPLLVSIQDACAMLGGISEGTLRQWIRESGGRLQIVKPAGGQLSFLRYGDLRAYVETMI